MEVGEDWDEDKFINNVYELSLEALRGYHLGAKCPNVLRALGAVTVPGRDVQDLAPEGKRLKPNTCVAVITELADCGTLQDLLR